MAITTSLAMVGPHLQDSRHVTPDGVVLSVVFEIETAVAQHWLKTKKQNLASSFTLPNWFISRERSTP